MTVTPLNQRSVGSLVPVLWRLARFDRPVGILLLLWPTLWALWLAAQGAPDLFRLLVFLSGVIIMRAAGCVLNDLADQRFDRHVERTAERVLTSGKISEKTAKRFAFFLLVTAACLLFFLTPLAIGLALCAVVLAAIYPFCKRFFPFPQIVLGVAFGFGIVMAFADTLNHVPAWAWIVWVANLAWVVAYDTAYAMVDREDDLKLGLKSSAISLGPFDLFGIAVSQAIFLLGMTSLFWFVPLGLTYGISLLTAALLSFFLLWRMKTRLREDCFRSFQKNHWIGAILWAGLFLDLGWS